MQTRPWEVPRLIVLGRGTPEEAVLTACKTAGVQGLSPNNVYGLCWTTVECAHCTIWASS